jgi:Protein of unknown function (DUF4038)/Domain of unknown function (DUF5060)
MMLLRWCLLAGLALRLAAQTPCAGVPAYTPCEFTFELNGAEAAAHPHPYISVELHGEFRSPHFRTYKMPAFWDGGRRMVIRFAPTEGGGWTYRLTSNIARWEGQTGTFTAAGSDAPGFVQVANVHHFAWTENHQPHLWMGDTLYPLATLDPALFQRIVDTRAAQKFNHIRGLALIAGQEARAYAAADMPRPAYFQQLDQRIRYMNQKGIVADLILGDSGEQLARLFSSWQQRRRYLRYIVARYAPMNVTWQLVREFETAPNGRALMKEMGSVLKKLDPYGHPRTSGTLGSSGALLDDGWMNIVTHHSGADAVCDIEHQLFARPFVNLKFAGEDSGAGKSAADDVSSDAFRHHLWNSTMDGDYPTYFNTGTAGAGNLPVDARYLDAPGAKAMTVWYNFFAGNRHWELEPYFDVDGGRALALEGVEYIVYVEHPGPVELLVEHHGYDVRWINPANGEEIKEKKGYKGEHFTGEPPDHSHDWVLHVSREGHKEGMLRSYKFESRRILMQVIEQNVDKVPFEIAQPAGSALSLAQPAPYEAKLKRETRATRTMLWLWTGEATAEAQGYRILATDEKGALHIPPDIAVHFPAVMDLRLYGMNANGKVYSLDKTFQLTK